jgi:Putative prokaryotic signal transducing protein
MVAVTRVTDPMTARILAARLGAAGIVWQLRGGDGLYPLGPVDVLVEEDDLVAARALLGEADVEDVEWRASSARWRRRRMAVAVVLVALLVTLSLGRYVVEVAVDPSPPEEPDDRDG